MSYETIFVFDSNLAGKHGAGAALEARKKWGAVYGQGVGRQGESYAIPTKDENIKTLSLFDIKVYVDEFLEYAESLPHQLFYVTRVGCGLAGYQDWQVAPLFIKAPANCLLDETWKRILHEEWNVSTLMEEDEEGS